MSHLLATIESKFGYMLETLCIFEYLEASLPSENFEVQTISREDLQIVLRKSSLGGGKNKPYTIGMGK